jgi:hypothetical protein
MSGAVGIAGIAGNALHRRGASTSTVMLRAPDGRGGWIDPLLYIHTAKFVGIGKEQLRTAPPRVLPRPGTTNPLVDMLVVI